MPKPINPRILQWYRCELPGNTLQLLNKRCDLKGLVQAGGHLALLTLTGTLSFLAWQYEQWGLMILFLFAHGTISSFCINAIHELVHGTVFKTPWINGLFTNIFSFLDMSNHQQFWSSHTEHHKYTLHPPDDLEVTLPIHFNLQDYFKSAVFNFNGLRCTLKNTWQLAAGVFPQDPWNLHLYPPSFSEGRRQVQSWARILLIGHGAILLFSLLSGLWILPFLFTTAKFTGNWLFYLCNNTQHSGLADKVADFRLCCRTIHLHPILSFLYWQMNFHTEHHMFAAIPCYNLKKCHEAIRKELPPTLGLIDAWLEIINIQKRQAQEPDYQYHQPLPANMNSVPRPAAEIITMVTPDRESSSPLQIWECDLCGFIYDEAKGLPAEGIPAGTRWCELPDDWLCPDCGTAKSNFQMTPQNLKILSSAPVST